MSLCSEDTFKKHVKYGSNALCNQKTPDDVQCKLDVIDRTTSNLLLFRIWKFFELLYDHLSESHSKYKFLAINEANRGLHFFG